MLRVIRHGHHYPSTPIERKRRWEGFPGPGWEDLLTNKRIMVNHLTLDGTLKGIKELREEYIRGREANNVMLGLLAAVGAGALAVPGVETAHWLTRAFWICSTVLAVCGVLVGGLTPGVFQLAFGDDVEQLYLEDEKQDHLPTKKLLSLDTNPKLLHWIHTLMGMPTVAIIYSGCLFVAGAFAFLCSADFGADAISYSPRDRAGLIVVAMALPVLYMGGVWALMAWCSVMHRRFRESAATEGLEHC